MRFFDLCRTDQRRRSPLKSHTKGRKEKSSKTQGPDEVLRTGGQWFLIKTPTGEQTQIIDNVTRAPPRKAVDPTWERARLA